MTEWECNFGFLPIVTSGMPFSFENNYIVIEPLSDFDSRLDHYKSIIYDGYVHQPVQVDIECQMDSIGIGGQRIQAKDISLKTQCDIKAINSLPDGFSVVKGSERTATLMRLPASHRLVLFNNSLDDPEHGLAAFVVHLLGFIFGTRLQFEHWYIDGKVPASEKARYEITLFRPDISEFINRSLNTYTNIKDFKTGKKTFTAENRQRALINSVFMYSRFRAVPFEWEKFLMAYLAFDAICDVLEIDSRSIKGSFEKASEITGLQLSKENRIDTKGNEIKSQDQIIDLIKGLRNSLMHHAIWDGGIPGEASTSDYVAYAPYYLLNIVERLIIAALVGTNDFTNSDWTRADRGPVFRVIKHLDNRIIF